MVELSGITSNSTMQLLQSIISLNKAFDHKLELNGKSFKWEPLALAA